LSLQEIRDCGYAPREWGLIVQIRARTVKKNPPRPLILVSFVSLLGLIGVPLLGVALDVFGRGLALVYL
jgi:hypothetical protein